MTLLYGVVAVALLWWLSNSFARANTAAVAKAAAKAKKQPVAAKA